MTNRATGMEEIDASDTSFEGALRRIAFANVVVSNPELRMAFSRERQLVIEDRMGITRRRAEYRAEYLAGFGVAMRSAARE